MPAKPGGSGPTDAKDQKTTASRIIIRLWKSMSSDASEARRLRPDRRNSSKDHNISNHKYTCRDEQALHVIIHMSL
jgi:hypothetical protein